MSLGKKIAGNILVQIAAKALDTALAVVAFGMITRYLDASGYGAFATITSFLQLFGVLADFGLSLVVIQLMSEPGRDANKNFNNVLTVRILTLIVTLGVAPLVALLLPYPPLIKIGVAAMSFSFFLSSCTQLLRVVTQVHLRSDIASAADIISRIVLIAGLWVIVATSPANLLVVLGVVTASNFVQCVWMARGAGRFIKLRLAYDAVIWKELFSRSWPIGISIICNLIYLRADTVILSLTHTAYDVGLYGAAYRILDVLVSIPSLVMATTLSHFSRSWSTGDRSTFQRYVQKTFDALALIACPIVIGTFFISHPMMALLAGPSFRDAGALLNILILGSGIIFFSSLFGHLINVIHAQRMMLWGYAASAVAGLAGYLVLIPHFGALGAAWMTVGVETLTCAIVIALFFWRTRISLSLGILLRALLAASAMGIILFSWPSLGLAATIALGAASYLVVLALLGGIPREIASLLHIFR